MIFKWTENIFSLFVKYFCWKNGGFNGPTAQNKKKALDGNPIVVHGLRGYKPD